MTVSLRLLLVFVAGIAILLAIWVRPYHAQRAVREEIVSAGGLVTVRPDYPELSWLLDEDYFCTITQVELSKSRDADRLVALLADMQGIECLRLDWSDVTDAGMKSVAAMDSLRLLNLTATNVTDRGLRELHGLPKLEGIWLSGTPVTDEGLIELVTMASLQVVDIFAEEERVPEVSVGGIAELRRRRPNLIVYTDWDD